jgi:3'-phosphoadenosine 5'-phosphosulfate sulfotransferase (PAPS reductase)/FAD synthetase
MYMRWRELELEQSKNLDYKIETARRAIADAIQVSHHRLALAFSAGKDSTVLADMIRRFFPDLWSRLHLIYGNTGVEYPECVQFWHQVVDEWGLGDRAHEARPGATSEPGYRYDTQRRIWQWAIQAGRIGEVLKADGKLKSTRALERLAVEMPSSDNLPTWPAGTRKTYWWCVDQYGWPLLGKAWSKLKARRINIDTFLRFSESQSEDPKLLAYYDVLRQVNISQACCDILKKEPARRVQVEIDVDVIFKGLMASESRSRAKNFLSRGYLFEGAKQDYLGGDPFFHCQPMAIWNDEDVWAYIERFGVPYSSLYDMGYTDSSGTFHKIRRNGCMGCATDLLFPNNHMAMLRRTHNKAWSVFMRRGMAAEIQKLQRVQRNGQLSLFDVFDAEDLLERRPCIFDSISQLVLEDDTMDDSLDFDPETD